jgi:hypothetical protein
MAGAFSGKLFQVSAVGAFFYTYVQPQLKNNTSFHYNKDNILNEQILGKCSILKNYKPSLFLSGYRSQTAF